jgi:hypothetical protein
MNRQIVAAFDGFDSLYAACDAELERLAAIDPPTISVRLHIPLDCFRAMLHCAHIILRRTQLTVSWSEVASHREHWLKLIPLVARAFKEMGRWTPGEQEDPSVTSACHRLLLDGCGAWLAAITSHKASYNTGLGIRDVCRVKYEDFVEQTGPHLLALVDITIRSLNLACGTPGKWLLTDRCDAGAEVSMHVYKSNSTTCARHFYITLVLAVSDNVDCDDLLRLLLMTLS